MDSKQKAEELVTKMQWSSWKTADYLHKDDEAKQCALICVDEIIHESLKLEFKLNKSGNVTRNIQYWQQVKTEIEKL